MNDIIKYRKCNQNKEPFAVGNSRYARIHILTYSLKFSGDYTCSHKPTTFLYSHLWFALILQNNNINAKVQKSWQKTISSSQPGCIDCKEINDMDKTLPQYMRGMRSSE